MQLLITGYRRLEEVWAWCQAHGIQTEQQRVYSSDLGSDDWAWQIVCRPSPKLSFLAVKFSDCCTITEHH